MDGAGPTGNQNQSQSQSQTITISAVSSGDVELEHRIFSDVQSAGRQLKNITGVVELLLAVQEAADPAFGKSGAAPDAIAAFRDMQVQILRAKSLRDPDRLIGQLEALRRSDPSTFTTVRERLMTWLQGT